MQISGQILLVGVIIVLICASIKYWKRKTEGVRLLEEYRTRRAADSRRQDAPARIADAFDVTVALTTRPMGPDEKHGREFYFVTEELFDAFAAARAFSENNMPAAKLSLIDFVRKRDHPNLPDLVDDTEPEPEDDNLSLAGPYYGKLKTDAVYDHTTYNAFNWGSGDTAHELMIPSGSCECEHTIGTPCYCYNPIPMTWDCHEWCANRVGGHLASVHSDKEQLCVQLMTNVWCAWIGGRREGDRRWKGDKGTNFHPEISFYAEEGHATWEWTDGTPWVNDKHYFKDPFDNRDVTARENCLGEDDHVCVTGFLCALFAIWNGTYCTCCCEDGCCECCLAGWDISVCDPLLCCPGIYQWRRETTQVPISAGPLTFRTLAGDVIIPTGTSHWHTAPDFHAWVGVNILATLPGMNTVERGDHDGVYDAGGDVTAQLMLECSGMIPRDASGADVCKLGRSYVNGKQPGPSPFAEYREWRHEGSDSQTLKKFEAKPLEIIIVYLRQAVTERDGGEVLTEGGSGGEGSGGGGRGGDAPLLLATPQTEELAKAGGKPKRRTAGHQRVACGGADYLPHIDPMHSTEETDEAVLFDQKLTGLVVPSIPTRTEPVFDCTKVSHV
jgi:hypothetical protein